MKTTADYLRDALDILDHCDEGTNGRCTVHFSDWAEGESRCEWYIDAFEAAGSRWKRPPPAGAEYSDDSRIVPCDHTLGPCPGCIERGARQERERLRKEWDRLMAASDWPFDAATFTVEFYKLLADPTP